MHSTLLTAVKNLAIVGFLIVGLAALGVAQTTETVPQNGKLGLNSDQKAEIKSIHQNEKQQIQAIKHDSSLSKEQKKERIREIRETSNSQINALLTPDQQKKFKEAKHRRHARRKAWRKNGFR
jgi:hypothetical protein